MSQKIDVTINGDMRQLSEQMTLVELLELLDVNQQQVAVEINTKIVPRESHAVQTLADGDQIEIVTLVGGG